MAPSILAELNVSHTVLGYLSKPIVVETNVVREKGIALGPGTNPRRFLTHDGRFIQVHNDGTIEQIDEEQFNVEDVRELLLVEIERTIRNRQSTLSFLQFTRKELKAHTK